MSPAAASASTGSGCSLVVNAGNSPQELRLDLELPAPSVGGIWLFAPRVNGSRPRCPQQRLAPPTARAARWLSPGLLEKGDFDMARLLQVDFNSQPVAVHCLRWIPRETDPEAGERLEVGVTPPCSFGPGARERWRWREVGD
ncbi:hypothetical protein B0H11DRAFT_1905128 [Mycena galericulata]|nr:hypothetical protein B0H11DRAFT_1905128 [Mycena galericulata]